jgi:hypothetical protein
MSLELSGSIKLIGETMSVGTKGFVKREFVLTVPDGKYPQDIQFELGKERCDIMNKFSVGDSITVHFDVRGREYNGRHYVNLQAWKVDGEGSGSGKQEAKSPQQVARPANKPAQADHDLGKNSDGDPYPF